MTSPESWGCLMSDPTTQVVNLILDQLNVHDEVFHNIEDWAKELYSALNKSHKEISGAFHSIADLIEDQERRIEQLEDKVMELERR